MLHYYYYYTTHTPPTHACAHHMPTRIIYKNSWVNFHPITLKCVACLQSPMCPTTESQLCFILYYKGGLIIDLNIYIYNIYIYIYTVAKLTLCLCSECRWMPARIQMNHSISGGGLDFFYICLPYGCGSWPFPWQGRHCGTPCFPQTGKPTPLLRSSHC